MRRSRSARPGRCFSAASVLLLHLCLPRLAPGDVLRDPPDKLEVEKRALSTPAAGAGLATGYQGLSAYGFYDVGEDCTPSPLWSKEVDAESYELGCREIKVGSKTIFCGERFHRTTTAYRVDLFSFRLHMHMFIKSA